MFCQQGKLFHVFPTIPMQKLVNFGHGEGHYFEFQNLDMENLEKKSKKWQRPLTSGPRRPMAVCPGQRAPTRAR
jgi:hypothetical protein